MKAIGQLRRNIEMQKKAIEINRTNALTATDLLQEININLEKLISVDQKVEYQSYMTGHKRKPNKYEGLIKRHKVHFERLELRKYVDTIDSFEYNWLQLAAEFEAVLLSSDLPVIIRQPYIDEAKYKGSVSDSEWANLVNSDKHNIYMDLIACLVSEFPNNYKAYKAEGLKELEHALDCHKNGHFSGACINIMRAAIHLKNLERQKFEVFEQSGRAQQDSGRSVGSNTRKSPYEFFFPRLQQISREVRKSHPFKTKADCYALIAEKANKEFKKELNNKNLAKLKNSQIKEWVRSKKLILESRIKK